MIRVIYFLFCFVFLLSCGGGVVDINRKDSESIKIRNVEVFIRVGESVKLTVDILPPESVRNKVSWISGNTAIATVDADASVLGISEGRVIITATVDDQKDMISIDILRKPNLFITEISFDTIEVDTNIKIDTITREWKDSSIQVVTEILPEDHTEGNLFWIAEPTSVATVVTGLISFVSPGQAKIIATVGTFSDTLIVNILNHVTMFTLSEDRIEAIIGTVDSVTIITIIEPMNHTDGDIIWTSDDSSVAEVSESGVIQLKSVGTTIIRSNIYVFSKNIEVIINDEYINADSIKITDLMKIIKVDSTVNLENNIFPLASANNRVTWRSGDEAIATVDQDGKVLAISIGQVEIIATVDNKSDAITLLVEQDIFVTEIIFSHEIISGNLVDSPLQLTYIVRPSDHTEGDLVWESKNRLVATVSESGLVSFLSVGETIIIGTIGTFSASIPLIVR